MFLQEIILGFFSIQFYRHFSSDFCLKCLGSFCLWQFDIMSLQSFLTTNRMGIFGNYVIQLFLSCSND